MDLSAEKARVSAGVRRRTLALDGSTACIGEARQRATEFLTGLRVDGGSSISQRTSDLTVLVVSELVTNACKYAPGPALLELWAAGDQLEIVVWDSDPVLPVARAADVGRVGQHGLEIVMAVAASFEAHRAAVGKRLVVRLPLADESGAAPALGAPEEEW